MATQFSLETVIFRLPIPWRGLLRVLSISDRPLVDGEVWIQQNRDSAYGDALPWTALVASLCVEEPTHCTDGLKFTPRLFHFSPSLQHLLVAVIHRHRQEICVNALQHLATVMEGDGSNHWLALVGHWLKRHCERSRDTSECSSYTFTAESQDRFRALCKELSTVEHGKRKRIWRIQSCLRGDGSGANAWSSSSGEACSPLPASLPVVNDIETPCRLPKRSPTDTSSDSCTSSSNGPVHKRIKLQGEAASVQEFRISNIEENSKGETDGSLDPDIHVKVARLKELWDAGTENPLPTEALTLFTKCSAQTVTDVCNGLAKSGLSDVAMATACKHLCGVSKEVSHENAMVFASSLILPQVLGLQGNASRTLLSGVIPFAGPFAKPLIERVLIPCVMSDKFGNNQLDILSHVLKSLNPADQKEFLRKFLSENKQWNESTSTLLQNMLDLKVDMDGEMLSKLMLDLTRSGGEQMKGLKFAKVLLNIINKHGKQLTPAHIGQLSEILQSNESFLKKPAMAALTNVQKQQGK